MRGWLANKTTLFLESITLLNKNSCQGGWGYVWHQIRFGFCAKWSGWAWPAMGSIFGLQGMKKRQEALESHCRPSPPPPPRHLAFVFTWRVCACVHTALTECIYVCCCECVCLQLHPVHVASCPWLHHWRQLMLSHGGIVAAPAANNQRQLFGKYQRCLIGSTDGLDFTLYPTSPPLCLKCKAPDQLYSK